MDRNITVTWLFSNDLVLQHLKIKLEHLASSQIAGAVALAKRTFPNHTAAQLVDRLLASADNIVLQEMEWLHLEMEFNMVTMLNLVMGLWIFMQR